MRRSSESLEIDQLTQLRHAPAGGLARQPVQPSLELQQLRPRLPRVERHVLQRDTDAQPHRARLLDHVEAGDRRATARGCEQGAQHAHGRRFAGTVGAEESVDPSRFDVQVDAVDGGDIAEGAGECFATNG